MENFVIYLLSCLLAQVNAVSEKAVLLAERPHGLGTAPGNRTWSPRAF